MPLIPALGKQKQTDLCEDSLVYRVSSRTARAVTQRNPVLKKYKNKTKQKNEQNNNKKEPIEFSY